MGANVFGTPITSAYIKASEYYHNKDIPTRHDRAKVAMENKNAEGKDSDARNYVWQLCEYADQNLCNTMCLVYNATGSPVIFRHCEEWKGMINESYCPMVIANGQWGAFLFVPDDLPRLETKVNNAAFIYQGKNSDGKDVNWVTAFVAAHLYKSKIYAEITPSTHYFGMEDNAPAWETLKGKLFSADRTNYSMVHDTEGASMYACIGNGNSPMLEVILTLPGVLDD